MPAGARFSLSRAQNGFALVASVGHAQITGLEDTDDAAVQVALLRGANIIPSAQPEKAEHQQHDDDGTDEPDDSVHDAYPLLARVG